MKPYLVLSLLVSRKSKSCSCSHQAIVSNLRVRTSGATLQKHFFLTKKKLQIYKEGNSLCGSSLRFGDPASGLNSVRCSMKCSWVLRLCWLMSFPRENNLKVAPVSWNIFKRVKYHILPAKHTWPLPAKHTWPMGNLLVHTGLKQ